jgi:hypothetical protein
MNNINTRIIWTTIISGALLAGCGSPPAPGSTTPTTTSATAVALPPTPPAPNPAIETATAAKPTSPPATIGPNGYGKLTLRMAFAEVEAAGFIRDAEPPGKICRRYGMYVDGKRDGSVFITRERGVEAIVPGPRVRTAEGVEVGWTADRVRTVYSELDLGVVAEMGRAAVPPRANPAAVYRLVFSDGVLNSIALQLPDQGCYE